jgi:hypothetical protein
MGKRMAQEKIVIFHLIFDMTNSKIDALVKDLEKIPGIQLWRLEGSEVRIGQLPNIFKAIPIDKLTYQGGWLVIRMHETTIATHLFVVCDTKDRQAIAQLLEHALHSTPGMRLRIERETPCAPT